MEIKDIKSQLSIGQVLNHYGVSVKGQHCCCPFTDDKTPSMQVYGDTIRIEVYAKIEDDYKSLKRFMNLEFPYFRQTYTEYFENMRVSTGNLLLYDTIAGLYDIGSSMSFKINFKEDLATINFNPGVGDYYDLEYKYNPSLKDWELIKSIYREEYLDVKRKQELEIPNPAPTLSEFDLLEYL